MSVTSIIIDPLLSLHGAAAYTLVGVLAFVEAAVFVGFLLPGETAVILGGVLAYRNSVSLSVMIAVVILAAVVGDSVGYGIGKRYGRQLLALPIFARRSQAIDKARMRLQTNGGSVVLLSRFTAFLRAVMPGLAGTSHMPYRKFLVWNAAGGIIWGAGFSSLGYLAGASYAKIETYAGYLSYAILAIIAAAALVWIVQRHRGERNTVPTDEAPASLTGD